MTKPKPWTYFNDGKRQGIVLLVHRDGAPNSLRTAGHWLYLGNSLSIALAMRGDKIIVNTGNVRVQPGDPAFVAISEDMRSGWTNNVDETMVLSAGTFTEANAHGDPHLAVVELGGNLFPEAPAKLTPAREPQSVETTQALAFMRYVALDRKLREVGYQNDCPAGDTLRNEMDSCWYAMTAETIDLTEWATAVALRDQQAEAKLAITIAEQRISRTPVEPRSLRDIIAAFPGVIGVDIVDTRSPAGAWITAKIQAAAAFNVVALQNHLHERVPVITLSRLHIEVERMSFICDVCKQCWLAAQRHEVSSRMSAQASTETPAPSMQLQDLGGPAAADYWRAIQETRNALQEATEQLTAARTAYTGLNMPSHEHGINWFGAREMIDELAKLRKQLPDMPETSAALDGGCALCGETSPANS